MRPQASTLDIPLTRAGAVTSPIFARVAVHREVDTAVMEAWATLEAVAPCSIYQTRAWLAAMDRDAWPKRWDRADVRHRLGRGRSPDRPALPRLAATRSGHDRHVPRRQGQQFQHWPGAARAGLDPGRPAAACSRGPHAILGAGRPDAFVLLNQPWAWNGVDNPLAALPHQPSPSAAFGTTLTAHPDDLFATKLSKDTRKKLRKKEARLAELGALAHVVASTAQERATILHQFFAQRLERFRAQNIVSGFDDPQMRSFIERASAGAHREVGIELHALYVGDRVVAVYGGASHRGCWSGMFNSFDADPGIAKSSPGDLLLMKVIAGECAAGRTHFDLGIGEARYKAALCDEVIPLFDTFLAATVKGWCFIKLQALALRAKRSVKQSPRLFALAKRLRALRA